jgi:glutaredoxin
VQALILYSKPGCHLCEKAETLFYAHRASGRFNLEISDIAESDELMKRYGIRIPVIRDPHSGREIGWPFDERKLSAFLNGLS